MSYALLAKNVLEQLDTWDARSLRSGEIVPVDAPVNSSDLALRASELSLAGFGCVIGDVIFNRVYSVPSFFEERFVYVPACFKQSDSQHFTHREQRAKSIRTLNLQTEANVIRVLDFERPFPAEESAYNPPIPQTPRILKLKR